MGLWQISNAGDAVAFHSAGMNGEYGLSIMQGPEVFSTNWDGASYFPNGSHKFNIGGHNGLVETVKFNTQNHYTPAGTKIINNADSIGLSTDGLTGAFTCDILHPEKFHQPNFNTVATAPRFTRIVLYVQNGIIYGLYGADCYQEKYNIGSPGPLYQWPFFDVGVTAGIQVSDKGSSVEVAGNGLSASIEFVALDDVYFWQAYAFTWRCEPHYVFVSLDITDGLVQSLSIRDGGWLDYWMPGSQNPGI